MDADGYGPVGCLRYSGGLTDYETAQSKVLYVNLEIQKSFAQRRLKTLANTKGIVQEAGRLEVWNLRGHATSHMEIFPRILDRIADDDNGLITSTQSTNCTAAWTTRTAPTKWPR